MPDTIGDQTGFIGLSGTLGDQPGDYDMPTNAQTPNAFGNIFNQISQAYNNSGLSGILGGALSGAIGDKLGQLAAFGGLGALLNKFAGQQSQQPVGYQGGIPQYTASRTQYDTGFSTDAARLKQAVNDSLAQGFTMDQVRQGAQQKFGISPQQISDAMASPAGAYRRPGQGGITYFSPVQYNSPSAEGGIGALTGGSATIGDNIERRTALSAKRAGDVAQATSQPSGAMDYKAAEKSLLSSPQYGGQYYGSGIQRLGGLPANLSQEQLAKLFPKGTSEYIPQEVSVSIPDYFGYIVNNPNFDTLYDRANAAQRAFSRSGADPAQMEYEMKNYLNNRAGGLPYTGGVDQGVKPIMPLLTSIDAAAGRLTAEQSDALQFIINNAETYNRLKQDIPVWEKEGNTAYLAKQKPYFEELGNAIRNYQSKLSGLDPNTLASKELFSLIPTLSPPGAAAGGQMPGGIAMLAQGRYLKGNGDGVSDSIPARFSGSGQEARLADGEFVIPARVVSEIGNGSSDAGARKLYAMLDRVESHAKKAKRGKPSGADRELNKLA